ncbi:MAG: 3-methyl-2-oxobutanoate dehydrogenase subunit VorB [Candidatus Omnitrophota bacterium]
MEKILLSGNEAAAEGAIRAGCRFYAGYPITPQNELIGYMAKRMPEAGGVFLQSESEIAAINMVFGASVTGNRAMTSSSSPGISLKQEGISYLAACELPAVIVNVMRGGPGLGNIAPAQADYFQATKGGGHGGYHIIVLAPSSVLEMFELTYWAFDLADTYRTPVMILADGMLGQMMEPLRINRKIKKSFPKKPWALTGCKGRKPNNIKSLFLETEQLERLNTILQKKYLCIKQREVKCETRYIHDSKIIVVAYGTVGRICKTVVSRLRTQGFKVGLIRPITLWPFPSGVLKRVSVRAQCIYVVEMSAGQMVEDVRLSVEGRCPVKFFGKTGGEIPSEREIITRIKKVFKGGRK